MCSTFFMKALEIYLPERADKPAFFDCRVWNTPNKMEAVNAIVWRELDATKNAVSTAAHTLIGHKELQNKSGSEMQEMLFTQHGINFNEYPTEFKRGAYFRKLACRDQPYNADPSLREPTRNKVFQIELPQLSKVANKIEVIFDNADPILHEKLP
jgi:tRNA(His) 5'-end guanylyltransferase